MLLRCFATLAYILMCIIFPKPVGSATKVPRSCSLVVNNKHHQSALAQALPPYFE